MLGGVRRWKHLEVTTMPRKSRVSECGCKWNRFWPYDERQVQRSGRWMAVRSPRRSSRGRRQVIGLILSLRRFALSFEQVRPPPLAGYDASRTPGSSHSRRPRLRTDVHQPRVADTRTSSWWLDFAAVTWCACAYQLSLTRRPNTCLPLRLTPRAAMPVSIR